MLALLAFGTGLLEHVPDAALAGILLFVALRIIRVKQIAMIYRQSMPEFFLILATAALIIVLPIQQGAALGIILSLLHGIWSTTRAKLVHFDRVPGTTIWWPSHPHMSGEHVPGVAVVGAQAADLVREQVPDRLLELVDRPRAHRVSPCGHIRQELHEDRQQEGQERHGGEHRVEGDGRGAGHDLVFA